MSTNSTNDDQIFSEDQLITALRRRADRQLRELSTCIGEEISGALGTPSKVSPDWPEEAAQIFEAYQSTRREYERRNSKRCSQQLSRFMAAANGEAESSDALQRWWMNRY